MHSPRSCAKGWINQWLGSLMCAPYKYKVFTVGHPDAPVPFAGVRFTREAPGGYDVLCRQRIASLASYRPLYQAVLDAELTLMAGVALRLRNQFGAKPRQLRVNSVVVQIPKKHTKRLLEWREEAWPTGNKRFRVSQLEPDSRTLTDVGCFNPVCAEGKEPVRCPPWVDSTQEQACLLYTSPSPRDRG